MQKKDVERNMENIKTVVFDLDGTIYQNNDFHHDYIRFLLEDSEKRSWEHVLVSYVEGVYCGRNLIMNRFYRSKILSANTPEAYFSLLEQALLSESQGEAVSGYEDCIYLGDAWAVVTLIGKTLGLLEGDRADAIYHRTRNKMSADGMQGHRRLHDCILQMNRYYTTVLLTNSYSETAEDFLKQLGFENIFEKVVFSAQKPWGMVDNLKKHCPDLSIAPQTFLSIGDNAFNDLLPLMRLGSKGLWINPFQDIHEPPYDVSVHSLDELADYIEDMCRRSECSL